MKKILLLVCIGLFQVVNVYAFNINFSWLWESFKTKLVWVHFKAWGNNFWWYFFVQWFKSLSTPVDIKISSTQKITKCKEQIKWYYFNSMHGQILYPLDNDTLDYWKNLKPNNYQNLAIAWGLYTNCDWDPDSIYGQVVYKTNSTRLFSLQAGFEYNYTRNSINWTFANSLQKVYKNGGTNIIGLLYDSSYGIWFVWWKVTSHFEQLVNQLNTQKVNKVITSLWNTIWTTIWAIIDPISGIWINTKLSIFWLLWYNMDKNTTDSSISKGIKHGSKSSVSMQWKLVTISNILNKLTQNSTILCRWNWNKRNDLSHIKAGDDDIGKTICIKTNNKKITINDDITLNGQITNIVIKWKNNKLIIKKSQEWPWYINIFVDNGYVLFDNSMDRLNINGNWKVVNVWWVTSGAVFNGNIYTKWLIAWYDSQKNKIGNFIHKMYIIGSIATLNTLWTSTTRAKYLTSLWLSTDYVDITKIFSWECMWENWSDGVWCWNSTDNYGWSSFVIRKETYPNELLK